MGLAELMACQEGVSEACELGHGAQRSQGLCQEMWSGLDASRERSLDPKGAGVRFTRAWVPLACPGGAPPPAHPRHGRWSSSLPGFQSTEPTDAAAQRPMAELGQSQGRTTRHAGREIRAPGPQAHGDVYFLTLVWGPHILECNKVHWGGRGPASGLGGMGDASPCLGDAPLLRGLRHAGAQCPLVVPPQQWLNRRPQWTPGPTSSPVQNRERVPAAPDPVGQEEGICDSVVTICWGKGQEHTREQRRCTSWWGYGLVAGGWAAGTPASGLGRCGGWGEGRGDYWWLWTSRGSRRPGHIRGPKSPSTTGLGL